MVDLASATQAASGQSSATSTQKLADDMDTFILMLTTQLQNQDPLDPQDSSEFTNQLVQFANVEQQIEQNENLENLIAVQLANLTAASASYIDRIVQAQSNQLPLQDGFAKFSYSLSGETGSTAIVIRDLTDNIVYSEVGQTSKGTHFVEWDGKDQFGNQLPDSIYKLEVTTINKQGAEEDVQSYTTVFGKVTALANDPASGDMLVALGDAIVPMQNVVAVRSDYGQTLDPDSELPGAPPPPADDAGGGDDAGNDGAEDVSDITDELPPEEPEDT